MRPNSERNYAEILLQISVRKLSSFLNRFISAQIAHFFLTGPVCNVVNLSKTMLYMEEMKHNLSYFLTLACANSVKWWENENDEKQIINADFAHKWTKQQFSFQSESSEVKITLLSNFDPSEDLGAQSHTNILAARARVLFSLTTSQLSQRFASHGILYWTGF